LEKEENLKLPSTETADEQYVYYIAKSLPFSDQVIFKEDNNYLLNVRKIYTDNTYYGVCFTTFDSTLGIQHHFKCKDRPIGDLSVVEDKNKFLSKYALKDEIGENNILSKSVTQKEIFFGLPYRVFYFYDNFDGKYFYTQYLLEDGRILRGLYGAKNEKHLLDLLLTFNGFATLGPPTKKEVIAFYEDKMTSYANNQVSVSTDYSEIIIEHTTQYETEWSDIKRRKKWERKNQ